MQVHLSFSKTSNFTGKKNVNACAYKIAEKDILIRRTLQNVTFSKIMKF